MNRGFFYKIVGFEPSQSFLIELDGSFAKKAFETELPDERYDFIQERAQNIIERIYQHELNYPPCIFVETESRSLTYLVHSVSVPGNACGLNIDHDDNGFGNLIAGEDVGFVRYYPGNIDTTKQAFTLLSIWLMWQDIAEGRLYPSNF